MTFFCFNPGWWLTLYLQHFLNLFRPFCHRLSSPSSSAQSVRPKNRGFKNISLSCEMSLFFRDWVGTFECRVVKTSSGVLEIMESDGKLTERPRFVSGSFIQAWTAWEISSLRMTSPSSSLVMSVVSSVIRPSDFTICATLTEESIEDEPLSCNASSSSADLTNMGFGSDINESKLKWIISFWVDKLLFLLKVVEP